MPSYRRLGPEALEKYLSPLTEHLSFEDLVKIFDENTLPHLFKGWSLEKQKDFFSSLASSYLEQDVFRDILVEQQQDRLLAGTEAILQKKESVEVKAKKM